MNELRKFHLKFYHFWTKKTTFFWYFFFDEIKFLSRDFLIFVLFKFFFQMKNKEENGFKVAQKTFSPNFLFFFINNVSI